MSLHMMYPLSVSSICKEVDVKHLFNINGNVVMYLASNTTNFFLVNWLDKIGHSLSVSSGLATSTIL